MLAKNWKKFLFIILIIACVLNLIFKLNKKVSFAKTIDTIKEYIQISEKDK